MAAISIEDLVKEMVFFFNPYIGVPGMAKAIKKDQGIVLSIFRNKGNLKGMLQNRSVPFFFGNLLNALSGGRGPKG
jgi:hypothetical protein